MDKVIFGPAGKPKEYKGRAYEACGYLNERRLFAYEYQSTHGLRIKEENAKKLKFKIIKFPLLHWFLQ